MNVRPKANRLLDQLATEAIMDKVSDKNKVKPGHYISKLSQDKRKTINELKSNDN